MLPLSETGDGRGTDVLSALGSWADEMEDAPIRKPFFFGLCASTNTFFRSWYDLCGLGTAIS